jgi:hypothetical protein
MRYLYECVPCAYQYSVTVGTIFHDSHMPLRNWYRDLSHLLGKEGYLSKVPTGSVGRELSDCLLHGSADTYSDGGRF